VIKKGESLPMRPPNFSLQLSAGRSLARRPSHLRDPKRLGVTPLADAARRIDVRCGKRRAALPLAHGASPQLSERSVRRSQLQSQLHVGTHGGTATAEPVQSLRARTSADSCSSNSCAERQRYRRRGDIAKLVVGILASTTPPYAASGQGESI
jgi:hypothetical protein